MYRKKAPPLPVYERKDITDFIDTFMYQMHVTRGRVYNRRNPGEVEDMKQTINDPRNTSWKSLRDIQTGEHFWHEQEVDYVRSNLKRGYIFYFICNGCGRRVKYLYVYTMLDSPLCRHCCRLKYEQPSRNARALSRALRRPYLSSEAKYTLIRRTGITTEDVLRAVN